MKLVLGSSSPRRREILETLGLAFEVVSPDIDETRHPEETPGVYVERVARAKAQALATTESVVLAADTAVVFKGRVLGKPGHPEEARSMLRILQGERHEVFTGVALAAGVEASSVHSVVDSTVVEMAPMTDDEIAGYVAGGEPMDKAGAYALQGYGGVFVKRIEGSPSTVIGLAVHLLPRLFTAAGLDMGRFTR